MENTVKKIFRLAGIIASSLIIMFTIAVLLIKLKKKEIPSLPKDRILYARSIGNSGLSSSILINMYEDLNGNKMFDIKDRELRILIDVKKGAEKINKIEYLLNKGITPLISFPTWKIIQEMERDPISTSYSVWKREDNKWYFYVPTKIMVLNNSEKDFEGFKHGK